MNYSLRIDLDKPFDETVGLVKEALAANGFGVLTEIDLKQTLKKKLDVDVDEQVILGACNPGFAHKGLQAEPSLGLLLPCNVVVRRDGGRTVVEAINPDTMVTLTGNEAMESVADSVRAGLQSALDSVAAAG